VPSVDRARRLLGLKETVDLQEAIRRTAAWYAAERKRKA
jgi:nucleoside-diphosphate-sugar epimerase